MTKAPNRALGRSGAVVFVMKTTAHTIRRRIAVFTLTSQNGRKSQDRARGVGLAPPFTWTFPLLVVALRRSEATMAVTTIVAHTNRTAPDIAEDRVRLGLYYRWCYSTYTGKDTP